MELKNEFEKKRQLFERLEEESVFILKDQIKNIKIHSLMSRIKTYDSFSKKVQNKNLEDPFNQIEDLLGLRIVALLRSDLNVLTDIIRSSFITISEDNKINGQETSSFGYMSYHFIVTLRDDAQGPRYTGLHGIKFEIQIRTVAMDAWATISHYLDYKTDHDVPTELRKDFYALSGLFYVADTHFEMFYEQRKKSKSGAVANVTSGKKFDDLELNLDNLTAYLKSKFKGRRKSSVNSVSELIDELTAVGYKNIGEIDKGVAKGMDAFIEYEKSNYPMKTKKNDTRKFYDVGVIRGLFSILDMDYLEFRILKSQLNPENQVYSKFRKFLK